MKLVSIITAVYNGEKYLEETLLSVFAQTYSDYELIVVDDGSPSRECEKICQKYAGRLAYISQKNTGLSGARNRGLQEAKGEYIAFIDQDDVWLPDKLGKQVALLESLRSAGVPVDLVYTPLIEMDDYGREYGRSSYARSGDLFREMLVDNVAGTPSSVLVRKDVLDAVGNFDPSIRAYSDWELFIRIARRFEIHCLNEYLTRYRRTASALSKNLAFADEDVRRITRHVLSSHQAYLKEHGITQQAYLRPIHRRMATLLKNAAYQRLFLRSDAALFRDYIRRGWLLDPQVIGLKPWVYYILSLISTRACWLIKKPVPIEVQRTSFLD